jgi:hypothetical protein
MAINRYDNPQIFQYQSQFVPTELPWDMIQNKADVKKKERDDFRTNAAKLAATPTGTQYTTDHWGRTVELPDYKISSEKANVINTKIANLSKKMAGTELNSDLYAEYAELQKEKLAFDNLNSVFDKRTAYINEESKYRRDQKVNPGDPRAFQTQMEIDKMIAEGGETYVPTTHGIQDFIDPGAWVNTTMAGVKEDVRKTVSKNAGYFNSLENVKITREKVLNALTGGFEADQNMQESVNSMAMQNAYILYTKGDIKSANPAELIKVDLKTGNIDLENGTEMSVYQYTKQNHFAYLMQNAEKFVFENIKYDESADTTWQYKDKLVQDKILAMPISGTAVEVNNKNFMERTMDLVNFKKTAEAADTKIPEITKELEKLATYKNGVWVAKKGGEWATNPQKINQLVSELNQYNQAKDNYRKSYKSAEKAVATPEKLNVIGREISNNINKDLLYLTEAFTNVFGGNEAVKTLNAKLSKLANESAGMKFRTVKEAELYQKKVKETANQYYKESGLLHLITGKNVDSFESSTLNNISSEIDDRMMNQDADLSYQTMTYPGDKKYAAIGAYIASNQKGLKAYDENGNSVDLSNYKSIDLVTKGYTLNTKKSQSGTNNFTISTPVTKEYPWGTFIENVEVELEPNSELGRMIIANSLNDLNYMEQFNGDLTESQEALREDIKYAYVMMTPNGALDAEKDAASLKVGNTSSSIIEKDGKKLVVTYKRLAEDDYYVTSQLLTNDPNNRKTYSLQYIKDNNGNTVGTGHFKNLNNFFRAGTK